MGSFVVWIDRDQARVFQFNREVLGRVTVLAVEADLQHFYARIASQLNSLGDLLLLGPGVAKFHFNNYLIEQLPRLAKKVVGCESLEQPEDSRIRELAKNFFMRSSA